MHPRGASGEWSVEKEGGRRTAVPKRRCPREVATPAGAPGGWSYRANTVRSPILRSVLPGQEHGDDIWTIGDREETDDDKKGARSTLSIACPVRAHARHTDYHRRDRATARPRRLLQRPIPRIIVSLFIISHATITLLASLTLNAYRLVAADLGVVRPGTGYLADRTNLVFREVGMGMPHRGRRKLTCKKVLRAPTKKALLARVQLLRNRPGGWPSLPPGPTGVGYSTHRARYRADHAGHPFCLSRMEARCHRHHHQ